MVAAAAAGSRLPASRSRLRAAPPARPGKATRATPDAAASPASAACSWLTGPVPVATAASRARAAAALAVSVTSQRVTGMKPSRVPRSPRMVPAASARPR